MVDKNKVNELKRAIYDKLPPRRKKFIDKIGFDNWDPFQEPKHPIDIRKDVTKRTTKQLINEFLKTKEDTKISLAYEAGVYEICMGLYQADEKYKAMFDFSIWYYKKLKDESLDPDMAWEKR